MPAARRVMAGSGGGFLTGSQVFPDGEGAQQRVRYVEVREHLELDDLVGHVEERLGVHGGGCGCTRFVRAARLTPLTDRDRLISGNERTLRRCCDAICVWCNMHCRSYARRVKVCIDVCVVICLVGKTYTILYFVNGWCNVVNWVLMDFHRQRIYLFSPCDFPRVENEFVRSRHLLFLTRDANRFPSVKY